MITDETLQFSPEQHRVLIAAGWQYRDAPEGAGIAGFPNRVRYIRNGHVLAPSGFSRVDILRPPGWDGRRRLHFRQAATLDGFRKQVRRQTIVSNMGTQRKRSER